MKEATFVSTHKVNGVVENKPEKYLTKDNKENLQCSFKAKVVIIIALSLDEYLQISHRKTTKEMWDILQITHKGTNKVKRERLDTLTMSIYS